MYSWWAWQWLSECISHQMSNQDTQVSHMYAMIDMSWIHISRWSWIIISQWLLMIQYQWLNFMMSDWNMMTEIMTSIMYHVWHSQWQWVTWVTRFRLSIHPVMMISHSSEVISVLQCRVADSIEWLIECTHTSSWLISIEWMQG